MKKPTIHQKPLAPMGKLNRIAKRMTKQSRQELATNAPDDAGHG